MKKCGVKFWSRNILQTPEIIEEISVKTKEGVFDFVEIFAFKDSFEDTSKKIFSLFKDTHVNIHASHGSYGFDTGNSENFKENLKQFNEAQKFADLFNSEIIVTHPGFGRTEQHLEETIKQFKLFDDERLTVENLPVGENPNNTFCYHGTSPQEISTIISETKCKFCLDYSHAICAANSLKVNPFGFLKAFNEMNPVTYHISDGGINKEIDEHLHIGEGDYPFKAIIDNFSSENAYLTLETGKYPAIFPWMKDISNLKAL